jgi:hypothetical protein
VKTVEFVGLVVEVLKQEKYTLFTLDDSTQCVKCWLWRPTTQEGGYHRNNYQPSMSTEECVSFEVRQEVYQHLRGKVNLGGQIKVQGKPHWFQGSMQIKAFSIQEQRDPNAETEHRFEASRLGRLYLQSD